MGFDLAAFRRCAAEPTRNNEGWYCCGCGEDMTEAADEIARLTAIVDKPQWQRNPPDKSGWWWFWYGDADCAPAPVSIMYSGSDGRYFASSGQLGWTRRQYVDDMPGYWMPLPEPPIQTADAASR